MYVCYTFLSTVEPLNKGHFGDNMNSADLFFVERFSSLGSKCIVGIVYTGTVSRALCREVCYTVSSFRRVHCYTVGSSTHLCTYVACVFSISLHLLTGPLSSAERKGDVLCFKGSEEGHGH